MLICAHLLFHLSWYISYPGWDKSFVG